MLTRPFIFITFKKLSITIKDHHIMNHMEISYLQVAEMLFFKELLHFFHIFLEEKSVTIHVHSTALLYCFIPANHCWNLLLMERTISRCWWGWSVICCSWCKQITYYFGLFLCINCTLLNMFISKSIYIISKCLASEGQLYYM